MNAFVEHLPCRERLTPDEADELSRAVSTRVYQAGEAPHSRCEACLGMLYVAKGSLRVYISSEDGRELTLFHLAQGDYCALTAGCVIGNLSIEAMVISDDDACVLSVGAETVHRLMDSNIYFRAMVYEIATRRFSAIAQVLQEVLFSPFDRRLAKSLLRLSSERHTTKLRVTQEEIAREVNSAREVVSRTLKKFEESGLIRTRRGTIELLDVPSLENLE